MFCHITTQIQGEKYGDLLSEKGGNGFPYLVFMDQNGDVLAVHEGKREVDAFSETAKKAQEYVDLKKKADAGDKKAIVEVVFRELRGGRMKLDVADKKLAGIELSDDQKKELEQLRADVEVGDILHAVKTNADVPDAGKKFAERKKAGKPAPSNEQFVQYYWQFIMTYAEQEKDPALYEDALKALKEKFGKNPKAKAYFDKADKTLEKLKADAAPKGDEKK